MVSDGASAITNRSFYTADDAHAPDVAAAAKVLGGSSTAVASSSASPAPASTALASSNAVVAPVARQSTWSDADAAFWAAIEAELMGASTDASEVADASTPAAPSFGAVELAQSSASWDALVAVADARLRADDAEELPAVASAYDGPDWALIARTPYHWPYSKCQKWSWRMGNSVGRKVRVYRWPSLHACTELDETAEYGHDEIFFEW